MNNKIILSLILGIFLFSFTSAVLIGTYKINEEMSITNYCKDGTCTYMNLTSIKLPNNTILNFNTEMTQNVQDFNYSYTPTLEGEYTFVTCGNPSAEVICNSDTFKVNSFGAEPPTSATAISNLIIIIFLITLMIALYTTTNKINFEQWNNTIHKKYINRNYVKLVFGAIFYNIMKNIYVIQYLLGFVILLAVTNTANTYAISTITSILVAFTIIYSIGAILIAIYFFSHVQEWIMDLLKHVSDLKWGTA